MTTIGEGAPSGQGQAGEKNGGQQKQTAENPHWIAYIEGFCALALVLITGTYTYYSSGQLHKMKRSVEAAEGANKIAAQALTIADRGWMEIRLDEEWYRADTIELVKRLNKLQALIFPLTFANVGKIPIKNITLCTNVEVPESNKQPTLQYIGFPITTTDKILFPQRLESIKVSKFLSRDIPVTINEYLRKELLDGKRYIAIYAKGDYSDAFGKHWVHFCIPLAFKEQTYTDKDCSDYNDAGDYPEPAPK